MRILIDECLNWRLGRALTGHHCVSVQKMGWSGIKNGQLLTLAEDHQATRGQERRRLSGRGESEGDTHQQQDGGVRRRVPPGVREPKQVMTNRVGHYVGRVHS